MAPELAAYAGEHDEERDETPAQRLDRNWDELLQEIRVTQTGIQVLFGFLLTLPFQARFADLDPMDRTLFLAVVALVAASTVLNLTPVVTHRLLFRRHRKDALVRLAGGTTLASLLLLGLALAGGVALIVDTAVGRPYGWWFGGATLAVVLVGWLLAPVVIGDGRRRR